MEPIFFGKMLVFGRTCIYKPVEITKEVPKTSLAETGFIDEFRFCFPRLLIPFKKMWYYTAIKKKHYSTVFPGFKTIYSYFHDYYCF